jgi:hypothetical protein
MIRGMRLGLPICARKKVNDICLIYRFRRGTVRLLRSIACRLQTELI